MRLARTWSRCDARVAATKHGNYIPQHTSRASQMEPPATATSTKERSHDRSADGNPTERDAKNTKVIALHQVCAEGCNHEIEANPRTTCQV